MSKSVLIMLAILSVVTQWAGIYLIPLTEGLTKFWPTFLGAALFLIGIGCLAKLVSAGIPLGIIFPALSIAMPVGAVLIGVIFFGEPAPPAKLIALFAAAGLVGYAATV
ncbi:hypothetical protein [Novosphingobium mathurense]|uniref:Quaternary ammonium compound-resistance protein SugE n=1 Tax=Novosphingobium mathurense TaxID=428990 RepID=A0A1U6IIV5_9SPHN|nr:hypothetical protein [Novosphingobium mathurense]SLK07948.1 quaternary ammonium compound-resistance protein SugE [Novosphingobium mathurense]